MRPSAVSEIASTKRASSVGLACSRKKATSKFVGDVSSEVVEVPDVDGAGAGGDVVAGGVSDVDAAIINGDKTAGWVSSEDGEDEALVDFFFFLDADGIVGAGRGS